MTSRFLSLTLATSMFLLAACGGADDQDAANDRGRSAAAAGAAASTGRIIEITMHTDDKGNYFEPARIEAELGDVLRFKLVTGVHNVHFLADSNPGANGLPAASAYAQIPGQTIDVPLNFGEGEFFFQCDPHALLGMVGRVKVED